MAHCYGKKGNEWVAPEVILKMMFLLLFDDIKSRNSPALKDTSARCFLH